MELPVILVVDPLLASSTAMLVEDTDDGRKKITIHPDGLELMLATLKSNNWGIGSNE